jgi:hypothetical protein
MEVCGCLSAQLCPILAKEATEQQVRRTIFAWKRQFSSLRGTWCPSAAFIDPFQQSSGLCSAHLELLSTGVI